MIDQAMSKRLPEGVFLYPVPGNPVALGKDLGFLQSPLILNRGASLAFVKPGA
ncbi:MAG: hypothetical protein WCF05_15935 [Chromatiaceae bacterium]